MLRFDLVTLAAPCSVVPFLFSAQVSSASELARLLGCESSTPVKVVSVVGNTGDGKSYTLNHVFFNGRKVFATSSKPSSCTLGVWVAYDQSTSTIVVDTEGMMGVSNNSNQRMRMLLKVRLLLAGLPP